MDALDNIATKYTISRHCKERYAERIMSKDNTYDVNYFILNNEEKISNDIHKMIEYGQLIYTGRQSQKDGKGDILDVYLNGLWVVLVNSKSSKVITLYKIDLGLDYEFNKAYVSAMMEKLNGRKKTLESVQEQVVNESDMYRQMIEEAEIQIKDYKTMIKNLEELCEGYKTIIDNNCVKVSQANKDVAEVLNTLIGKREF